MIFNILGFLFDITSILYALLYHLIKTNIAMENHHV